MFRVENITKLYNKKNILNAVGFTLNKGESLGILGGNGSGKTTLLSILANVIKRDSGEFFYNDSSLFNNAGLNSSIIGYVPQQNPLIEELSGYDNLLLWYNKENLFDNKIMSMLDIYSFWHTRVCKMSGGMKKRISIACAMANSPELLLLDEPTEALDIIGKDNIFKFLQEFKKSGGSVILVSHSLDELSFCESHYILKNGCLTKWQYNNDINAVAGIL